MNATNREPLHLPGDQPPLAYVGAERALLGALMERPRLYDDVADLLTPASFYRPDHGRLWALIGERIARGQPVDRVALGEHLLALGDQDYGGYGYVTSLPEHSCPAPHVVTTARIVRDAAARRAAQRSIRELSALVADPSVTPDMLASAFAAIGASLEADAPGSEGDWVWMEEATEAAAEAAAQAQDTGGASLGIEVPLAAWAEYVPYLTPGELHVIAARPAMGKSALARGIAEHAAVCGHGVGIVSLEMAPEQIASLSLASWAEVDARDLRNGRLDQAAWDGIERARADLGRLPIAITRRADLSVEDVIAMSRRLRRTMAARGHTLGLLVIDYLQLLSAPGGGDGTRAEVVGHQTRQLKLLARALGVPVVLLSQLNRAVEQRSDKRPIPADLRESGSIEQDAATITMVYREAVYDEDADPTAAELIVRKNRYGTIGTAHVRFVGSRARFEDGVVPSLEVV